MSSHWHGSTDSPLTDTGRAQARQVAAALRADGAANLGILQGLVTNVRSTGEATLAATLEGPLKTPQVTGTMTIADGRIRHFDLPHALEAISGVVR